jgi:hypothetical protein
MDAEVLLKLTCSPDPPTPLECIEVIENMYGDECIVLESATKSARDMNCFEHGRRLLDMLRRLVTEYRDKFIEGGDNEARKVFSNNEYAAKESETVMGNQAIRRLRTFTYRGEQPNLPSLQPKLSQLQFSSNAPGRQPGKSSLNFLPSQSATQTRGQLITARSSSFWNGIHDDGKDVDIRSCAKSFDRPPEAFAWRGLFITTGIMFSLRRP